MTHRHPYHPYGVYPVSGDDIVARYIETAYENVKKVADSIEVFLNSQQTLADLQQTQTDMEAIQTEVQNLSAVSEGYQNNIDTITSTISSLVDTVNAALPIIQQGVALAPQMTTVANDSVAIQAVGGSINAINTVFANLNDILTLENNLDDIIALELIQTEIVTVANALSDINTVIPMQSNIDTILANLADVQAAANLAALSRTSINLTLGSVEVTNSVYTDLYSAIEYAKTVTQVGGKLVLTVPTGNFDSGNNPIVIDSRLDVELIGSSGSVISGSERILIDGGSLIADSVNFNWSVGAGTATILDIINGSYVELDSCILAHSGGLNVCTRQDGATTLLMTACQLQSEGPPITLSGGDYASIIGCTIESTYSSPSPATPLALISVNNVSSVKLGSSASTTTLIAARTASVGVKADGASTVVKRGILNTSGLGADYDPLANTFGNLQSQIVTE